MSDLILDAADGVIVPVHLLRDADVEAAIGALGEQGRGLAAAQEFKGKAGQVLLVPDAAGALERVLYVVGQGKASAVRALAAKLPRGIYEIVRKPDDITDDEAALAFALGSYRFDRYKKKPDERPRLLARGADVAAVRAMAHACSLART